MKTSFFLLLVITFTFSIRNTVAQTPPLKTETFKVYGNCEMCQERIEDVLKKKDGITKKFWNQKSKMMTVTFDSGKISLTQIKQKIADEGYDTDEIRGSDAAYKGLPKCCRYERAHTTN